VSFGQGNTFLTQPDGDNSRVSVLSFNLLHPGTPLMDDRTKMRPTRPPADPQETRPNTPEPQLESVLANRYVLQERLGAGGMGTVFKALDREVVAGQRLGPPLIALKIVNPDKDLGQVAIQAIKQEGEFLRRLRHDNVMAIYSVERDGETWFLTMELLEGESLDSIVKRFPGGVELAEGLPLIRQLCAGITYLHEHKVIHSDLKPSNVFVTRERQVKILDFGISSKVRAIGEPETLFNPRRWGALSPPYACLEMWSGATADPRDDVYSFGCLVYELLSGHHPFGGCSAEERSSPSFAQQSIDPIPGLTRHQNAALQRALALKRQDRTASIALFHDEFFRAPDPKTPVYAAAAVALALVAVGGIFLTRQRINNLPPRSNNPLSADAALPGATSAQAPPTTPKGQPASTAQPSATRPTAPQTTVAPAPVPSESTPPPENCPSSGGQAALEQQVVVGLEAQQAWSLGGLSESDNVKVLATIRNVANCLRRLAQRGYTSEKSRAWLIDADNILKGDKP